MPFAIELDLGAESPITFDGWIDDSFERFVLTGTAFALARSDRVSGHIVTNAPMVLTGRGQFSPGSVIDPGKIVAIGTADGDETPHGRPFCIFLPEIRPFVPRSEIESDHLERFLFERWTGLLDPSHFEHEDIILALEFQPDARSVPYLKKAIETKPELEYLAYDDYGAYYKKCLWALQEIGTSEATNLIRECAASEITALREQAIYRLKRMSEP